VNNVFSFKSLFAFKTLVVKKIKDTLTILVLHTYKSDFQMTNTLFLHPTDVILKPFSESK
jgi:hypothetical protein